MTFFRKCSICDGSLVYDKRPPGVVICAECIGDTLFGGGVHKISCARPGMINGKVVDPSGIIEILCGAKESSVFYSSFDANEVTCRICKRLLRIFAKMGLVIDEASRPKGRLFVYGGKSYIAHPDEPLKVWNPELGEFEVVPFLGEKK